MFIARFCLSGRQRNLYDIAIVTDDMRYIEYEVVQKHQHLTKYVAKRLMDLMASYTIDSKSTILLQDTVDHLSPLHLYFKILHQHINFKFDTVSLDRAARRVSVSVLSKKDSEVDRKYFNKLWNRIIRNKSCPWITQNIDNKLQNLSYNVAKRKRTLRFFAYYMVKRRRLMEVHNRSIQKKLNIEAQLQQQQSMPSIQDISSKNQFFDVTV